MTMCVMGNSIHTVQFRLEIFGVHFPQRLNLSAEILIFGGCTGRDPRNAYGKYLPITPVARVRRSAGGYIWWNICFK